MPETSEQSRVALSSRGGHSGAAAIFPGLGWASNNPPVRDVVRQAMLQPSHARAHAATLKKNNKPPN